jgi:hypothetical protein
MYHKRQDDRQVMNWTGCGRRRLWHNRVIIPTYTWTDREKSQKSWIRIARVSAEVRNQYLLNASAGVSPLDQAAGFLVTSKI